MEVFWFFFFFFFCKQKTAYEIRLSLVGSEMCIRDRNYSSIWFSLTRHARERGHPVTTDLVIYEGWGYWIARSSRATTRERVLISDPCYLPGVAGPSVNALYGGLDGPNLSSSTLPT